MPTLSNAANSSVPGPFFHVPFMAVSSFASTAQYPTHKPTHDTKGFSHTIHFLHLNAKPAFARASPLLTLLPKQRRRKCRRRSTVRSAVPWAAIFEQKGPTSEATEVVDAHFVVQLEHAAQALHPPPESVLLVRLQLCHFLTYCGTPWQYQC